MLTVDTEALPKRASSDHVKRLMWGEHTGGTAGIREMAEIGDEFGVKHIYFVDLCGAYFHLDEIRDVVSWLHHTGQDVQLHTHPEYLPEKFWKEHGFKLRPRFMNQYGDDGRADFVIRHFAGILSDITGEQVLAHRAGSFRWNASTIRALQASNIPLSFNNSFRAVQNGQAVYGSHTNDPFTWSNGTIEVPTTERSVFSFVAQDKWRTRLTYPESRYFQLHPWWQRAFRGIRCHQPDFAVVLLHSWSLLYWDDNGHATYQDDARLEGYRRYVKRLSQDYDVITSNEFLDLHARGAITMPDTVDLALAELPSA